MMREDTQSPVTAVEPMLSGVGWKNTEDDDNVHALTIVRLSAWPAQYISCK